MVIVGPKRLPAELALVADLGEQNGELVDGAKRVADGSVERFDHGLAVSAVDLIVPRVGGRLPPGAGCLLGVVNLTARGAESHEEPPSLGPPSPFPSGRG